MAGKTFLTISWLGGRKKEGKGAILSMVKRTEIGEIKIIHEVQQAEEKLDSNEIVQQTKRCVQC